MRLEFFLIPIGKKYIKISLIAHEKGEYFEAFGVFNGKREYRRAKEKQEAINSVYECLKSIE
ncbi:hypothetical protein SLL00_04945 [Metabacillus indicus]|uniref:hypothetical protein n=1 Tax=Metabacillus indicus TaxID=246786 RepID=UPI002A03CF95|nr:hypothetical protein [Metabacillus indicus]MDX8289124.1 hypothetical protein [Metabacillus indicus]